MVILTSMDPALAASLFCSFQPSHAQTANTKIKPAAWTPIIGLKISITGIFSAAEARRVGPVHGNTFTPAAKDVAQARMRRSMPSRS